jgi:serine/threonine protein kinase
MGIVYRALHTRLKKMVAVKVLLTDRVQDPAAVARFHREREAVGKLDHPNLVRALDADEVEGVHFLVMEFCDGIDLACLLRRRRRLPVADACELVRQAAVALHYAHEHGLVHRDIKPSNLMLTQAGQVKVLDLGLALLQGSLSADARLTTAGLIMGTLDFMAPEQASDAHAIDSRADIYSLGCTLYCLLTDRAPFQEAGTPLQKIQAHAQAPVPPVRQRRPDVPEALAAVLDRMLAKEPDRRFTTAAEVAVALRPFTAGSDSSELLSAKAERAEATGAATGEGPDRKLVPPRPALSSQVASEAPATPPPSPPRPHRSLWFRLGLVAALMLVMGGAGLYVVSVQSHPSALALETLRFTVRRDNNDDRRFYRDLVRGGAGQAPEPIDPPLHIPKDDFRLDGRFTRATYWYVVWIDTAGKVEVVGHSEGKQADVRYPVRTDRMASVDQADAAGIHLLVLVAGTVPPAEGVDRLTGQLRDVGLPPQILPRRWVVEPRGAGKEREAPPGLESSAYLKGIGERMPPGLEPIQVLFLRTEK